MDGGKHETVCQSLMVFRFVITLNKSQTLFEINASVNISRNCTRLC